MTSDEEEQPHENGDMTRTNAESEEWLRSSGMKLRHITSKLEQRGYLIVALSIVNPLLAVANLLFGSNLSVPARLAAIAAFGLPVFILLYDYHRLAEIGKGLEGDISDKLQEDFRSSLAQDSTPRTPPFLRDDLSRFARAARLPLANRLGATALYILLQAVIILGSVIVVLYV